MPPLLAGQVFHLDLYTSALTYIPAFGLAKGATTLRRHPRCLRAVSMADGTDRTPLGGRAEGHETGPCPSALGIGLRRGLQGLLRFGAT